MGGKKKGRRGKKQNAASSTTTPQKDEQVLPSKLANKFKQVVKSYETKQYKKGLKDAETILKTNGNHGETLAMKGLILNCMDKKKEGEQCIKLGLTKNMKSHVCWHVYGLLHRANHDYHTAAKAYKRALGIDKENLQIMKDLSLLQIQIRDLEGFTETRRKILLMKSSNRNNWIAYAIGAQLNGDLKQCEDILGSYEQTLDEVKDRDYEHSEMLLYKNGVIEEQGEFGRVIEHMNTIEKHVLDKPSFMLRKARILLKLNKHEQSQEIFDRLMNINPDNLAYHEGEAELRGIKLQLNEQQPYHTEGEIGTLKKYYEGLQEKYPRSLACHQIPLQFLQGDNFREYLGAFVIKRIRKGIPSLFRDLKQLYTVPQKVEIIESVINGFETQLRSNLRFSEDAEENSESPACLLWTLFLTAQHYNQIRNSQLALEKINEAINHTPTMCDLYLLKARIYKHAGAYQQAYELADEARRMDTADRYLNIKVVRYAFRLNMIETAQEVVKLFLRENDGLNSLHDMQCMWYEIASGRNYMNQRDYGMALKRFYEVNKHYEDIIEDQFDFHTYCLRKMTLRSYLDMLKFEDSIRSHRRFRQAAKHIIQCYLILQKERQEKEEKSDEDEQVDLSDPDKAREAARKKRAAAKARQKEQRQKNAEKQGEEKSKKAPVKNIRGEIVIDEDPKGKKYLEAESFLDCATKFVRLLQEFASDDFESHMFACQVYLLKGRYLLVLKSLKRALQIDSQHAELHLRMVEFLFAISRNSDNINPIVKEVIDLEVAELQPIPLEEYNKNFIDRCSTQSERLAAGKALHLINPDNVDEVISLVTNLENGTHLICEDAYTFIKNNLKDEAVAQSYKESVHEKYPLAAFFKPPGENDTPNGDSQQEEGKNNDQST